MNNKEIIDIIYNQLIENHLSNRIEWIRKNPVHIKFETSNGELSFYVNKTFKLSGWEVTPAYFTLQIDEIVINLFLSDFPQLKDMANELTNTHFSDLKEDNNKSTEKILEFSRSISLESYRDTKINKILNINEQR